MNKLRALGPKLRAVWAKVPRRAPSDVIDVAGLGCLDGAAWWWHPIVGLVAIGLSLMLIGRVMDQ